jgi:HAD superfamily hydrolase (TIGR01509 family)
MIRGIIFDCFGVLHLDSNSAYFAQFPQHRDVLHDLNVRADHGFIDKLTYLNEAAEIVGVSSNEVLAGIARENTLNRPLVDYIATLKPHYKIGMLSNIGRGWIEDFFDRNQLNNLFDAVVLSNEEGITKPNPLVFQHTAEKLGLEAGECIMIDDRPENCAGAEAAGMKSILYTSNEALYTSLDELLKTH